MQNSWVKGGMLAGLAIALVLGALSFYTGRTAERQVITDLPSEGKVLGLASYPVLVEVFSDYQCPWCARAALGFERDVVRKYIANKQVRLQFRDFPFVGLESYWAAVAAGCAANQDRFWDYHDKVFSEQKGENQGRYSKENLKKWAGDIGLDTAAFDTCFAAEQPAPNIRADYQLGVDRKVNSTPTFFINGRKILGIPTEKDFNKIVMEELEKAK